MTIIIAKPAVKAARRPTGSPSGAATGTSADTYTAFAMKRATEKKFTASECL